MSKAEKANQESNVFLQQVKLKNYKSIIEAEIDFKPGLNIIIGNNGSGKTNFLNNLHDVLNKNWDEKVELDAEVTLGKNDDLYKIIVNKNNDIEPITQLGIVLPSHKKTNVEFYINNEIHNKVEVSGFDFNLFNDNRIYYNVKFLQHGIPKEQGIIENPVQFTFSYNSLVPVSNFDREQTYFIKSLFYRITHSVFYRQTFTTNKMEMIIEEFDEFLSNVKQALKNYTDIKDIRVSPNYNLYSTKENQKIEVHNLYLEFNINNIWMPYNNLSDGSKRLFFIISEILSYDQISIILNVQKGKSLKESSIIQDIILLEEPELGIHPHQLHKLMLFIKEQSKEKQIILTTHSPQVLNILDADELDRIIICNYDKEKGTQLNHLTERQIKKGQMYMQDEGFLSDYWLHSDLEPAD